MPADAQRRVALAGFLEWCATLPVVDGDDDGVINDTDCAPVDGGVWAAPSVALDLLLGSGPGDELSWSSPLQPGATTPLYDLLRSDDPEDFTAAVCVESGTSVTTASDPVALPPGSGAYYLVRSRNACGATLGTDSRGSARSGAACP